MEQNYVPVPRDPTPEKIVSLERASPTNNLLKTVGNSPKPLIIVQDDLADEPKNFMGM